MIKKLTQDTVFYNFWNQNDHFADLCNALLYKGKPTLHAEQLQELDSKSSLPLAQGEIRRNRDIIKKAAGDIGYIVVGIENQSYIDYAMPLRVMLYDSLRYQSELQEKKRTSEQRSLTTDELLSGIGKNVRIHAVITIVIYYGEKPWDAPKRLREMIAALPDTVKPFFKIMRSICWKYEIASNIRFKTKM